ncbi:response regulator transcription factor [Microbacterium sp. CPCC 204701]|uniref:response regulator transcription factor n=1 Tax=Microbacterium sp. CPCC 204701 TaxID=2493084 RepID=UPI000FDAF5EB|nr:response regulator transcription factor [Microbacterium sp. CPCC 204701]
MSSSRAAPPTTDLADRRVLVVEDDATVREVVGTYLEAAGFIVEVATDGFAALDTIAERAPDLVVLDRMLPGIDGAEVCRRIRETEDIPVILLTALGGPEDRVGGLEAGADDYIAKPFSPRELVLRVQAVMRRSLTEFAPEAPFDIGSFHLDASARVVAKDGGPLALSTREFDLFAFLLKHPRRVFTREELLRAVWGWEFGDLSTVTVTMRRLREKIEDDPSHPRRLCTVWGVGYRFEPGEEAE